MRLDHVSYVASHDQISDVVNRIGSQIGTAFVDGGIHPKFGTRNFTAPLLNDQYIEVVCPLEHPATEQTAWGRAVSKKAKEGGGWFTWVFSTNNLIPIETKFGREATESYRTRPNGTELKWKQIGVSEITESRGFPFFIQWLTMDHPAQDGTPMAEIQKIVISDHSQLSDSWFRDEIFKSIDKVVIEWADPLNHEGQIGIISIQISTPSGSVTLT
jgi:hypothetical protein